MMKWTTLGQLRDGAIFKTHDGILAVKSEYYTLNAQSECVLLTSGEYAHFAEKNDTEMQDLLAGTPELLERAAGLAEIATCNLCPERNKCSAFLQNTESQPHPCDVIAAELRELAQALHQAGMEENCDT